MAVGVLPGAVESLGTPGQRPHQTRTLYLAESLREAWGLMGSFKWTCPCPDALMMVTV